MRYSRSDVKPHRQSMGAGRVKLRRHDRVAAERRQEAGRVRTTVGRLMVVKSRIFSADAPLYDEL